MDEVSGDVSTTLTDDDLDELGLVGSIELTLSGQWARVDGALEGLPHEPVLYRWREDSTGELALFIEVPLAGEVPVERLLEYRDAVRDAVRGATERTIYVHFVGVEDRRRPPGCLTSTSITFSTEPAEQTQGRVDRDRPIFGAASQTPTTHCSTG